MYFKNIGFRVFLYACLILLFAVGALSSCQQESGIDLQEIVLPSVTRTTEPTQQPATATVMQPSPTRSTATSEPTSAPLPLETPTYTPEEREASPFSVLDYGEGTGMPSTPATEPPLPVPTSTPRPPTESDATAQPTDTSKETPEPDALAIIRWQELDLPEDFRAIYPESFGVEKGATAREFTDSDGNVFTIPIENSFVFMDDAETSFIFGYTYTLDEEQYRQAFIAEQQDSQYLKSQFPSATMIDVSEIGDVSGGFSAPLSDEERIDSAQFLIGDVAAVVYIRYPEGQSAPLDVVKLAQVYADSLVDPEPRCQLLSITPVEDPLWPAYAFEATGFFPREQRIVELSGFVKKDDEHLTATMTLAGQTGETADQNGRVVGEIQFGPFEEEGLLPVSQELMLRVIGGFSGCEASETVTWTLEQTEELATSRGEVLDEQAPPISQPRDSETEGFRTHDLPGWGSLEIPEDWHIIYSPTPGLLLISSKDAESVDETSSEDALLQISDLVATGVVKAPIDIIREDFLPSLQYEWELISEPEAITINGQKAATVTYHGFEDFIEQMTIYQSQDGSRTAYLLSVIGEDRWPEYETIFETIRNSMSISPTSAGPVLSPTEDLPEGYDLFVDDEQGYQFGYPSEWQGVGLLPLVFSPPGTELPAEFEFKIGAVFVYPPNYFVIGEDPNEGFTAEGQVVALWDWAGTMAIQDAMITSELSQKQVGDIEYAAAYFVATDESRDNQPIYGFMGAVTDGEKAVKMISWFDDPLEYQDAWLNMFNSIVLTE